MFSESNRQPSIAWYTAWQRPVLMSLAIAVLLVIVYQVFERYLSIPVTIILLAIILTYLLRPIVERIVSFSAVRYRHIARIIAVLVLYSAIAWWVYAIGAVTIQALQRDAVQLQQTWSRKRTQIAAQFDRLTLWYNNTVPASMKKQIHDNVAKELNATLPTVLPRLMGAARKAFEWAGLLIELIFVPLVAFYLLTDGTRVREQLLGFVPARHRERLVRYAGGMDGIFRRYIIGQLILCAIAWIAVTIALLVMGIPGALLLGIVAGLSRAIPVIGPLVGGVPVLTAVLIDNPWPGAFWWVLIGFTLLHLFESKVLMPRILGDKLGVHPVIIIVSLLVGYELLGLLGMFIAPPAIAIVRFFLRERQQEEAAAALDDEPEAALAAALPDTAA